MAVAMLAGELDSLVQYWPLSRSQKVVQSFRVRVVEARRDDCRRQGLADCFISRPAESGLSLRVPVCDPAALINRLAAERRGFASPVVLP